MDEKKEDMHAASSAPKSGTGNDVEDNKIWAAISYIGILSIIVLLAKKDSDFAQFHAKQGFVLFIAMVILGFIPVVGWLLNIANLVLLVMGLINAVQGKRTELPLYGQLAAKINL